MNLKNRLENGGGSIFSKNNGGPSIKYGDTAETSTLHDEYSLNDTPAGESVRPKLIGQVPQFTTPTQLAQTQPVQKYAGGLDDAVLDRALDLTGTNTENRG
tara:strand:- start:581 stop:883 length:303 start_codon:yes stop_codon:yes gene_type:complete